MKNKITVALLLDLVAKWRAGTEDDVTSIEQQCERCADELEAVLQPKQFPVRLCGLCKCQHSLDVICAS